MKKSILFMISLTALLLVLSACGKDTEESDEKTDDKNSNEETFIFKAENGDIEVPKNPKRIVVNDNYVGFLLALGVTPVGTSEYAFGNPYYEGMLEGVESFGDRGNPSVEKILAMDPDLIITYDLIENVEQLEKIAPVISLKYEDKNYKDRLKEFGVITGKEKEADEWLAQWEEKLDELRPKVEEVIGDQTLSILSPHNGKGIYAWGKKYGRGGVIFYDEFGVKAPERIQKELIDGDEDWIDFSIETLPEFAGDIIITVPNDGDDSDPAVVYDNPLWENLPAVKNDKVYKIDVREGSSYFDPISIEKRLDEITKQILK